MTTAKTPNYTVAQENLILDAADAGTLNLAAAEALAANPAMNDADGNPRKARSIVAKINRMGLPYERKAAVSKSGGPIEDKADIVARIAVKVPGNLDGLDKAPKAALVAIAKAVAA